MSGSRPWVLHVCHARPNFMRVAPIWAAIAERGKLDQQLLHTGQHYDEKMSDVFFGELGLPQPDIHLGVGSGTQAEQTAKVMEALEKVVAEQRVKNRCTRALGQNHNNVIADDRIGVCGPPAVTTK